MTDQFSLFRGWQSIDLNDGQARYLNQWLSEQEQATYWQAFQHLAWESPSIRIAGKAIPIPRLNAWYADRNAGYGYSGIKLPRLDWTPELRSLKERVKQATGYSFNAVLANYYRDGNDSVDWHADDEPELGSNPVIASVSLGGVRSFKFKHRQDRSLAPVSLLLEPGSLLEMSGGTQKNWLHKVPKTKKVVDARINLTFRKIICD